MGVNSSIYLPLVHPCLHTHNYFNPRSQQWEPVELLWRSTETDSYVRRMDDGAMVRVATSLLEKLGSK